MTAAALTAADVDCVVVETWTSLLGLAPVRLATPCAAARDEWVHAAVAVDGPWRGTVRLSAPRPLAARCAAAMLGLESGAVDSTSVADALGELANVVGGSLKALLPPVCHLSLPFVVRTDDRPGAEVLTLTFDCAGDVLVVSVHPAEPGPH